MAGRAILTFADYDGETSTVSVATDNFSGAGYDALAALIASLWSAIEGVSLGLNVKEQIVSYSLGSGSGLATNPGANREAKWFVRYQDDVTGDIQSVEIPAPNPALKSTTERAYLDLSGTEGAAFVTAFEGVVKSRAGNAVSVLDAKWVGRNL